MSIFFMKTGVRQTNESLSYPNIYYRTIKLKERALKEFAPELDRIRVDTLTKHKDGSPDIQRVRTIPGKGC